MLCTPRNFYTFALPTTRRRLCDIRFTPEASYAAQLFISDSLYDPALLHHRSPSQQIPFPSDAFYTKQLLHALVSRETSNLHQKSSCYTRCIQMHFVHCTRSSSWTRRLSPNMKWYITHHTSNRSLLARRQPVSTRPKLIWSSKI